MATFRQARQLTPIYDKLLRHSSESLRRQQPNQQTPGRTYTRYPPYTDAIISTPLDILEINDHQTILHETIYHVNHLKTGHLTAKHLCHHIHSGLTPDHFTCVHPEDEDIPILAIPFEVTWKAT